MITWDFPRFFYKCNALIQRENIMIPSVLPDNTYHNFNVVKQLWQPFTLSAKKDDIEMVVH